MESETTDIRKCIINILLMPPKHNSLPGRPKTNEVRTNKYGIPVIQQPAMQVYANFSSRCASIVLSSNPKSPPLSLHPPSPSISLPPPPPRPLYPCLHFPIQELLKPSFQSACTTSPCSMSSALPAFSPCSAPGCNLMISLHGRQSTALHKLSSLHNTESAASRTLASLRVWREQMVLRLPIVKINHRGVTDREPRLPISV